MPDAEAVEIMAKFGKAIFSKDRDLLAGAITPDAEWHFAIGNDGPDGRVRRGIDGFMKGIAENDAMFEKLRFENVEIRGFSANEIVMTYLADGKRAGGSAFQVRGVELIRVDGDRVALKDVFWKQQP